MIEIRSLTEFDPARFAAVAAGYTTTEMYRVARIEGDDATLFQLTLERLPSAETFNFPHSEEDLVRYGSSVPSEFFLGAYEGQLLVGVALGEPHLWNRTLWVWEFHVAATHHGQGIGRRMMEALAARGRAAGLRALVCETQNTNVPAIRFYRRAGFTLDGVDVSYYTNDDTQPGRTVAVFMKRKLE